MTDALFDTQTPGLPHALGGSPGTHAGPVGGEVVAPAATPAGPVIPAGGSLWPLAASMSDVDRALILMSAVAPGSSEYVSVTIHGEPASKSRPRFTRNGRPYRTKEDVDAEKRTADFVRRAFRHGPWTGNVALAAVFFRPNRQRIDADNMLKHVCDAANGIAWIDDSQVTAVLGIAELDSEHPRTVLVFARHLSSLPRGTDDVTICAACAKPFQRLGSNPHKKTCSKDCWRTLRGMPDLSEPVPCPSCGQPFKRATSAQRFCSNACTHTSLRGSSKEPPRRSKCSQCATQLAHNRGGRCRDCWRASPSGQPAPVQGALEIRP